MRRALFRQPMPIVQVAGPTVVSAINGTVQSLSKTSMWRIPRIFVYLASGH